MSRNLTLGLSSEKLCMHTHKNCACTPTFLTCFRNCACTLLQHCACTLCMHSVQNCATRTRTRALHTQQHCATRAVLSSRESTRETFKESLYVRSTLELKNTRAILPRFWVAEGGAA